MNALRQPARLAAFILLAAAAQLQAGISHVLQSFTETNYSGYLIRSDESNASPGYTRDAIEVTTEVKYTRTIGPDTHYEYRFDFQLLDTNNNPVTLALPGNTTGTTLSVLQNVDMTFGPIEITLNTPARIRPQNEISAYQNHRVTVSVHRRPMPAGTFASTGLNSQTTPKTYRHFNSNTSNDIPHNVISEVTSVQWTRLSRVQSNANQSQDFFRVQAAARFDRYDKFADPAPSGNDVTTRYTVTLRDDLNNIIPLQQSTFDFIEENLLSYNNANPALRQPTVRTSNRNLDIRPSGQLLSRSRTYILQVAISHFDIPGLASQKTGNSRTTLSTTLLDFNGTLALAAGTASFTELEAPLPSPLAFEPEHILSEIRVTNQSGSFSGLTFGNGETLTVELRDNGAATLIGGTLNLNGTGQPAAPGKIKYTLTGLTISPGTITGNVNIRLPSGLGIADNPNTRIHSSSFTFSGVALTPQFHPVDATLSQATATGWAAEESKPFVFQYSGIAWDVAAERIRFTSTGNVQFVRTAAYNQLASDGSIPVSLRSKPSNDGYYRNIASISTSEVTIHTADNGSALISCDLELFGASYSTHFPLKATVSHTGGSQRIVNDLVVPSYGGLGADLNIVTSYTRDCNEGDCGGGTSTGFVVLVPGGDYTFTRDGGLRNSGSLASPTTLSWGRIPSINDFAHSAYSFTTANFHAPGIFLAASQQGNTAPANRPARLLFTGVDPAAPNTVERPGSPAYSTGLGDYAGLNFRVDDWASHTGKLIVAGQPSDPFPFTNRVKYIARFGGITGIHEAINGQFDPTATLYGIDFTFTSLGWAFRDNTNVASRTNGELAVPFPSEFDLEFNELMLTCTGGLKSAEIAPIGGDGYKKLAYWNADFRPLTLGFESNPNDPNAACNPANRRLVLGAEAHAGGIAQSLSGRIGFRTNGNLISRQSGELGLDFNSRFRLPNNFSLAGPSGQSYRATAVGEAYLNNFEYAPDPAAFGWMNFAALLDVPFFSDLEVHIHTNAVKNDADALYHLMGGFPDLGFKEGGQTFFTETNFDKGNRGYPTGVPISHYRDGHPDPSNENYRPIARKRWLNFIDLEYPLTWRPASKSFVSFKDKTRDFFVLNSSHRVDYLSPDFAEISFGGSASLIPKISIANFVADKATDVTAVLQQKLNTTLVDNGVQAFNEILDVKQREFFEKALFPAVDHVVDHVVDEIFANYNGTTWQNPVGQIVLDALNDANNGVVKQVTDNLTAAADVGAGVASVLKEIDTRLATAENALTLIEGFIAAKGGKPLGDLQETVISLAELVSGALDKPEFAEKINALMAKAEPRIVEIRETIKQVRKFITDVRATMATGGSFLNQINDMVASSAATIQNAANTVSKDIEAIVKKINLSIDNINNLPDVLRAQIKQRIHDYILGLPVLAEFNRLIKQRVYDTSALMTEAIDEVFDQINLTLRDVIKQVAGGLDEKFNEMIGDAVADKMATANIDGYAKIRNDSLTELRLDLKAKLAIPDEMKVHVFLVIKELSSENAPSGCAPETGRAVEVTMGAKDIAVEWLFPDTTVSIHSKFLLLAEENIPMPKLIGMGGGFDLKGEISFGDAVVIHQLGASVMFSKYEAYISAAAKVEVQGFAGGGGIFIGRACSIEPFFWDPTVQSILGDPPFTGIYGYGEFWIPIPTLIGIPKTCLFNLSAGIGFGAGVFLEGPTVFGKMFLGVSGDVLCIISITGEIILVGKASPQGLGLAGEARFKLELGWCPICLKFNKMIRMTRERGKWSRAVK
jgi:hypothetical protein